MDDQEKIYIEPDDEEDIEDRLARKTLRVLVFTLGQELYCVDVRQAKEVIRMPKVTRTPNVPSFVVGVTNFRGEILSILDLHYFFGVEQKGKTKDVRVIVTDVSGEKVGLMVGAIKDTLEIEEDKVQATLATLKGDLAEYTKGQIPLGDDILIVLDLARILNGEEVNHLRKGNA